MIWSAIDHYSCSLRRFALQSKAVARKIVEMPRTNATAAAMDIGLILSSEIYKHINFTDIFLLHVFTSFSHL